MNNNQAQKERRLLVEGYMGRCLKTIRTFDAIFYRVDPLTSGEYIRITDKLGGKVHLNVTAEPDDEIFIAIARVILAGKDDSVSYPQNVITNEDELLAISDLFTTGGAINE